MFFFCLGVAGRNLGQHYIKVVKNGNFEAYLSSLQLKPWVLGGYLQGGDLHVPPVRPLLTSQGMKCSPISQQLTG